MADKRHTYSIRVDWTGNQDSGTSAYRGYAALTYAPEGTPYANGCSH